MSYTLSRRKPVIKILLAFNIVVILRFLNISISRHRKHTLFHNIHAQTISLVRAFIQNPHNNIIKSRMNYDVFSSVECVFLYKTSLRLLYHFLVWVTIYSSIIFFSMLCSFNSSSSLLHIKQNYYYFFTSTV